ncbi:MAG: SNF2-related protein [Lentisphaeria bacterium]
MTSDLEHKLTEIAGKTAYQKGVTAYRNGAVLDVSLNGKSAEARIANSGGRFERVTVKWKRDSLQAKCTCSWRITPFCQHIVAAFLKLETRRPEILQSLLSEEDRDDTKIIRHKHSPSGATSEPRYSALKTHSLREIIKQASAPGRVELHVNGPPPHLESRWSRMELRIDLLYNGREYSGSNIKRLVETGSASGGMDLQNFSLQEQQLMRLVLTQAEVVGTRFVMNSYAVSDLLHCLTGFHELYSDSGRINVHRQHAELVMVTGSKNSHYSISPRFQLRDHGLLPRDKLKSVVGRGGAWVGLGVDYWWLPGVTDASWIRCFLGGETTEISAEDLTHLTRGCESHRLPARVIPDNEVAELRAVSGDCHPVLTLDWDKKGITARLEFEYGGKRVPFDGPEILWERKRFVARDVNAENETVDSLKAMGFTKYGNRKDNFILKEPKRLWNFLKHGADDLGRKWKIYYSSRFSRNRNATGNVSMKARTAREGNGWFELEYDFQTADGQLLKVDDVLAALQNEQRYIQLESGAVAELSDKLRKSWESMTGRASEQEDNRLRFGQTTAIAVESALEDFTITENGAWQELCEKLRNAEGVDSLDLPEKLQNRLRNYQKEGIAWLDLLEDCGFHGILADEMGLGKTVQALGLLLQRQRREKTNKPSLVICPTSLVENWANEARRFVPELSTLTITGPQRKDRLQALTKHNLCITSYALLRRDIKRYKEVDFDYVILDEAQHIKNPKTVNARTCKALRTDHRLILTGTPVENARHELWSLFDFLLPGLLGSRQQFKQEYESAAANDFLVNADLASQIRPFILRRTKSQVAQQLPPKMEQVVYCEMSNRQRQLYEEIKRAGKDLLRRSKEEDWNQTRFEMLALLMRLRQACGHPDLLPPG